MQIQVIRYKPIEGRNSLKASVDILFSQWGVTVRNIAYHADDCRRWFQIPGENKTPFLFFNNKMDFQDFQVCAATALDNFLNFGGVNTNEQSPN
jgi:hypothetical protein